jgi:hypothetical protein
MTVFVGLPVLGRFRAINIFLGSTQIFNSAAKNSQFPAPSARIQVQFAAQ